MSGSHTASMVGTGQQLTCSNTGDVVKNGVLLAAVVRRPLQHIHQVGDKEVVLQCRHTFFRQDRGLAANGTRQSEAVGGDVVLQAPKRGENTTENTCFFKFLQQE